MTLDYTGGATTTPSTPKTQTPSGKIEKVWLEHDVYKEGKRGMNVHVHFLIYNMKGAKGYIEAIFHPLDFHKPVTNDSFIPKYDNSEYSDYTLFMSYSMLDGAINFNERTGNSDLNRRGNFETKIQVEVWGGGKALDTFDIYFTYKK